MTPVIPFPKSIGYILYATCVLTLENIFLMLKVLKNLNP